MYFFFLFYYAVSNQWYYHVNIQVDKSFEKNPFFFLRHYKTYPLHNLKGNLCMKKSLEMKDFLNKTDGFSEKHKLIILMGLSWTLLCLIYFHISSQKQKRKHKILKYPRNVLTFKCNLSYCYSIITR